MESPDRYKLSARFNEHQKILNVVDCYFRNDADKPNSVLKKIDAEALLEALEKGDGYTQGQIDQIISVLLYYVPSLIKNG